MRKLGLIAGGGALPAALAAKCAAAGRPLYVLRLTGFAGPELEAYDGAPCGIAEVGRAFKLLRAAGCEAVCFAGNVSRPDFAALKPDLRGLALLPAVVAAARGGDDALLRVVLGAFEAEGFVLEGAEEVDAGLTLGPGALGRHAPEAEHLDDLHRALRIARAAGALDIGQAAVVASGLVLAVEAQEGTDAMLARVASLPAALRGGEGARAGVLAKAPKPIQDLRVDLPTLGAATVEGAAAGGLAGVVAEAGATLVVDREATAAAADRLGLFVWGEPPPGPPSTPEPLE